MTDLIDRQAAIDAVKHAWAKGLEPSQYIEIIPSAKSVRHGKNVGTDYDEVDQFVCSECGIELQDWHRVERDDDDGEETYHEYRFRYCPNCGARLDAERREK